MIFFFPTKFSQRFCNFCCRCFVALVVIVGGGVAFHPKTETIPDYSTVSLQISSLHTLNYINSPSAAISNYFLEVKYPTDSHQHSNLRCMESRAIGKKEERERVGVGVIFDFISFGPK